MAQKDQSVTIVGAGLVGTLAACILAKRNYNVVLYEKRDDIRTTTESRGKSINLALSSRGLKALNLLNLKEKILMSAVPMQGRCLHSVSGTTKCVAYDPVYKQCIYSVNRNFLNGVLLNLAETFENVKIKFKHKLTSVDFENGICTFSREKTGNQITCKSDLIIGADGAYSTVRKYMQETSFFTYQQSYIDHGYVELTIDPKQGKDLMIPNHLHIWPRKTFMLIALPNQDDSWTLTLFMPIQQFEIIDDADKLLDFFSRTFPDVLSLISADNLTKDFFKCKPNSLVTIKCNRFHHKNCVLLGDAAHAIVPFYGQGMNAGFEDCTILDRILNLTSDDVALSIEQFSQTRPKNVHAISELALYNYVEMRDLVANPLYVLRKTVDTILFKLLDDLWIPLYVSVTFTNMSYSKCISNRKRQDLILKLAVLGTLIILALVFFFL